MIVHVGVGVTDELLQHKMVNQLHTFVRQENTDTDINTAHN
jgi:hypothetical protein